jgi:soluble lytic murein transglycosylase
MKRIAATLLLTLTAAVVNVAAQSPDDIALAKLAVTAHSTGNLLLEQILLLRLTIESSGDLADAARHRLAENALERGDYAETIRLLNSGDGTADPKSPQIRRDRVLIGEAYWRLFPDGRFDPVGENAVLALTDLLDEQPPVYDDASLMAAKFLDEVGQGADEPVHLRFGEIYQANRYWDEARRHFKQVRTPPDAAEALFQIGRGYSQSSEYENAIPYYQSVIDNYPDTQQAKDSLLQLAAAYSRLDQTDEAIARYQTFIDKYPTDDKAPRAYLNIVDIYRDLGDDAHALEWCQKTEAAFPGKTPEALAIFDEAKIHASRNESQDEIAALERLKRRNDLGGPSQPGGTTLEEVSFMEAYAFEQLGRPDDAIHAYLPLISFLRNDTYYGGLADARERRLESKLHQKGVEPIEPPPRVPRLDPSEQPPRYSEITAGIAQPRGIDPGLLTAIMLQESKFDPQSRSNAAARGLMQFTHPQAVKIAKELGWTYFSDDELYSPENSIALAAQYLADLNAMFPGQTEAVVASYNGGEDNVKRWMARAKSNDPERYVPEIVYGQTKDYVVKVMANYRVYQQLYDEQLRAK